VDRSRPFSIEESIYSPLGYAGSYDLIGYAGDYELLADWKSARKRKKRSFIRDYELQVAAYTGCANQWRIKEGRPLLERAMIVVAYEDAPADVFPMYRDDLKSAWRAFSARLQQFQLKFGKVSP
jgi:hypothetical protein